MASPPSTSSVPAAGIKRFCGGPGCSRQISAIASDPHSCCVQCRGLCEVDKRCDECREWDDDLVLRAYKHQLTLRSKRKSSAKYRDGKRKSLSSVASHSSAGSSHRTSGTVGFGGVESEAGLDAPLHPLPLMMVLI